MLLIDRSNQEVPTLARKVSITAFSNRFEKLYGIYKIISRIKVGIPEKKLQSSSFWDNKKSVWLQIQKLGMATLSQTQFLNFNHLSTKNEQKLYLIK